MIGLGIHGWTRVPSNAKVHLVAPEGATAGVITIRERARQRSFAELIGGARGADGATWILRPTPIVNAEGEQGALASIRARIGGGEAQRDVAVFAGDGFSLTIVGATRDPAYFERTPQLVRELATRSVLALGVRRRLVLYPPPRGWHGVARGLDAHWHAPAFPRTPARMIVFPAIPVQGVTAAEIIDALTAGAATWTRSERTTPRGLVFDVRTASASRIAVATDARFAYAARIDDAGDAELRVLDATLDGMHPVPSVAQPASAVAHWIE